ncbi:thiamine ABC transporter permease [Vibrio hannami]|uniref:ABC transporter permease n=1 Tax=Vibrio hannami TaxID=2717094 RepID=UPI0024109AFA|nr:thiamine ABC transporter permease [Vibrio hannami]MDG3088339.1 thiamine ABC transporter permease [Vibrio hannami]
MMRLLYVILVMICIIPTVPGLVGVIASAFSYVPPLNMHSFSLDGFNQAWSWSGVWTSIGLTFSTSLISLMMTVIATFSILSSTWGQKFWKRLEASLSPMLAIPHVAFTIGLAFLLSPTGMIARILEPVLSNDIFSWLVRDPIGLGLILALTLKEIPFLLLMSIPILKQLNVEQSRKVAYSMGYDSKAFWWKCILPQWLEKIRFPLIAIIAFSASVVDVSLIIGPTNPPTFAVLVFQWFNEPDLSLVPRAAAGAFILFVVCTALIFIIRGLEWLLLKYFRTWQFSGRFAPALPGKSTAALLGTLFIATFLVMSVWSVAQRWRFPDLMPSSSTLRFWMTEWPNITPVIADSLNLALISGTIALLLAIIAQEYRIEHRRALPTYVIAIPMLVPQLSLLFGMQVSTLYLNSEFYYIWVVWSHVFFAFPYVYLSLDGPWRSFNQSYIYTANSLGKSPRQAWFKVKLPQLYSAVLFAWAIGASVSLAQYLPTLMLGNGRISTLTTEAVALASGYDRRITAIYAIWQTLVPFFVFAAIMLINRQHSIRIKTKGITISHESVSEQPHHIKN